ncbi:MAG: ASKHA domain-containing protein [Oscillospiraceae bacterium]|nr:ASKHA domain-containing protein [Oscillospiraceae bacterium]
MSHTVTIRQNGSVVGVYTADGGRDIRSFLAGIGVYLDSPCGGRGKCKKCEVTVADAAVLACQTVIDRDLDVTLPDNAQMDIAGDETTSKHAVTHNLGVAIDIGTTTVVAHLHDLDSGERLASASGVNTQRVHGADVVSRIEYSITHGNGALTALIQSQIQGLIGSACASANAATTDIRRVVIAGNTIMQHLAAGFDPSGMGTAPFHPVSLFGGELAPFAGLNLAENAAIFYCPCPASYVGGDITAGYIACDLEHDAGPTVFIDIGTNGEISLKVGDKYYCCATAAGPAFEGAEIDCGMAATTGSISHLAWDNGLKITTIGGAEPDGLCGSGLLDALALLLDTGAVDESGRMLTPSEIGHAIARYIGVRNGKPAFVIDDARDVYVSSADVRRLQLAKAAIAGGIATLLRYADITVAQVRRFVLAGGFGSYMDKNSAARIGLYPREFLAVTQSLGNTAGDGASLVLASAEKRAELEHLITRCEYLELSTSGVFNDEFIENMEFPEGR